MSNEPRNLTRADLAQICNNNPRAIRAFEQLLKQINDILPSDVASIYDTVYSSQQDASAKAQAALDAVARFNLDSVNQIGWNQGAGVAVVPGQMAWNANDGTLDIGMGYDSVVQQVGLETYYRVKASADITDGQLVMFDGAVGASGVLKAKPTTTALTQGQLVMGVATMTIAANAFGYVTAFGLVRGIDTTGSAVGETWADGDVLYYNPAYAGAMTKVEPAAPNEKVIVAAVVNAGAAGSGSIFVRTNFLLHLYNLSDVSITSAADTQVLRYIAANSRWENDYPNKFPIRTATSATSITSADYTVLGNATGGAFTATLPAASSNTGRVFVIKKIDASANAVTIGRTGSDTIDGAASVALSTQYASRMVQSNGSGWYVI